MQVRSQLRAQQHPCRSTRDILARSAAAVWWPYLSKSEKVGGWGQMSLHYYQHYMLPEPESGVMACFAKEVFVEKMGDDKIPAWAASFPSFRRLKPEEIPAGYVDGWGLESVVIHSDVALQYLVRKVALFLALSLLGTHSRLSLCSSAISTRAPSSSARSRPLRRRSMRVRSCVVRSPLCAL